MAAPEKKRLNKLILFWGVFLLVHFYSVVLPWVLVKPGPSPLPEWVPTLLGCLAGAFALLAYRLPTVLFERARKELNGQDVPDAVAESLVLPGMLIRFSFLEAISFLGVYCASVCHNPELATPFWVAAFLGHWLSRPSADTARQVLALR
jgi:hypothetical protein